tara:strand:- start:970 stop:1173 length:204 start_codon:yes stop_codon:yes gene_type:complete
MQFLPLQCEHVTFWRRKVMVSIAATQQPQRGWLLRQNMAMRLPKGDDLRTGGGAARSRTSLRSGMCL